MYYIYHIPLFKWKNGKIGKIGCTKNLSKRITQQGCLDYFVLETHDCIYKASEREIELQKEYGYKVDRIPYHATIKTQLKAGKSGGKIIGNIWGKIAGKKAVESGQLKSICSLGGKVSGTKAVETGRWREIQQIGNEKKKKPIVQYTKSGQFIQEWKSATDAAIQLNIQRANISKCIAGKLPSAGGYLWKHKK